MIKFKKLVMNISLSIAVLLSMQCYAEDIELYVNHNVEIDERARVLLIFDTSGSMAFSSKTGKDCGQYNNGGWKVCNDSRLGVAKDAMTELITGNPDIDFGLMRYNSTDGGYILNGIGSSHNAIKASIDNLPADGGTPLAETLWEAYLYITGKGLHYALNLSESSRDTNVESKVYAGREQVRKCNNWGWNCRYEWQDKYSYSYISPFADSVEEAKRCDNSVNIIYMTDGDPSAGSDNNSDGAISEAYKSYFGRYLNNNDYIYSNYLHQLAKVIHGVDANKKANIEEVVVDLYPQTPDIHETGRVYTVGFGSGMSSSGKKLLEETATLGGGQYEYADTAEQLADAFKKFITNIREVNDTFTSPSIASNNVDQTRSRESIYYAMFYPETGARWRGNLKKLKVSGTEIVDANSTPALNDDGLIKSTASTFWLPENTPPDGNSVESGGVNLHLTNLAERTVYTDSPKGGLIEFQSSTLQTAFGSLAKVATSFGTDINSVGSTIEWARGVDVDDEDKDSSRRDQRKDIFGDPLHSKPVTIDYGSGDIRILIGTNAGFLHMFQDKGKDVSETWSFIPSSLYKILTPLRNNLADTKVYGVDGPITVFFDDADRDGVVEAGDRVWAFFGMRRGGNQYYALDITNPDVPKLMWTIQGGSGVYKELAQTWSAPTVSYIKGKKEPVLIFGAGFDTNKDNVSLSNDTKGRGIYIVNASDGSLVWELTPKTGFKGKHSIAATVSILDSDYDGFIDRLYATDTAGSIWRVDMPSANPTDSKNPWTHFELAKLGGAISSQDRRFFYKATVARTMFSKVTSTTSNNQTSIIREDTPFDAILIGSGNRPKPTLTTVQDQLYMIRDINTVTMSFIGDDIPETITPSDLMNVNSDPFANALDDIEQFTEEEVKLSKKSGWYYDLPRSGEKSLAAATVVGGVAYFTSFTPASADATINQCSLSGGSGGLYAFHLHYGSKVYNQLRYVTSNDVPDTPQLYFGTSEVCDSDGKACNEQSQFLLLGPGVKQTKATEDEFSAKNPFIPKEILGPGITFDEDGKIKLVSDAVPIGFGFKTQQTFIYKRENNDNQK
ncbi:MAG: type IV pilus assembly protein PilY1 [Pseudoalteromonas rhizosphaerae]|jgi:type IV pilus assembly protein PilY1|uniref:Pilin biogenesis protein n=1 Tax=Pseudoalteromonas neustonica TaxID=1840331 RepID=A0ABY3FDM6_9GAMM|nr:MULTISPECIES: PilC/PilY family type IV pilus protein [Pseudoalteromonas]MBB1295257.1 pilin biogenesis protein [Pseudoalteromonas sp. SR41-4]MBB1300705.1 pilin biogenesis protein [Pseudoalteromonas sp. SR44-8]MBB1505181.1 pilin biogenesis protein [Pseudoalteromonas sp. SG41-1]TVU83448.1 pilin biogenesis protein [Pseudoalteromonas neustonica]|tara:strand:+ start:16967 stop:20176 length:3210 start_codon:yes stop_codon:yes gene_type:complete